MPKELGCPNNYVSKDLSFFSAYFNQKDQIDLRKNVRWKLLGSPKKPLNFLNLLQSAGMTPPLITWLVYFSAGVVSYMYFSAMGGISVTGIFLVEFKEEFNVSTTTVSVIGSIKIGLVMFCGKG